MPHQVTITGIKTGPDRAVTQTFLNVTKVELDLNDKILSFTTDPSSGGNIHEFDMAAIATITVSITAGNYSITVA